MHADPQLRAADRAPQRDAESTALSRASERAAPAAEADCLRWVQLTVDPAQHAVFLHLFKTYQSRIQNFPGCRSVELLEGSETGQFFTLSRWSAESDLENYRTSPLFAEIWPPVKATFSAPARAWTVRPVAIPA
jgi:heme-degrading monooxygenase HmoA